MQLNTIVCSDVLSYLKQLSDNSVDCCITSPPYYGLRNYETEGQIGSELHPKEYLCNLVTVFREVRRVLKPSGTFWLNIGDSYASNKSGTAYPTETIANGDRGRGKQYQANRNAKAIGYKHKELMLLPQRLAIMLQEDGWYIRSDIIWQKPAVMPESVKDRPTKSHEYVWMLTKEPYYFYDEAAIREPAKDWGTRNRTNGKYHNEGTGLQPHTGLKNSNFAEKGRNKRTVWTVATEPKKFKHFATFPKKLIEPMILAGCPVNGVVLDPFMGSGTTAIVALNNNRNFIGCDSNEQYINLAAERILKEANYAIRQHSK